MNGVDTGLPDPVQPFVVGTESAAILPVPVNRDRIDSDQSDGPGLGGDFEPDEPERGLAETDLTEFRQLKRLLMNRMILRRHPERLGNRLPERNTDVRKFHVTRRHHQRPVELHAEVENEFAPRRQQTDPRIEMYKTLNMRPPGQRGGIPDSTRLPDHPHRRNISADTLIRHGIGIGDSFHDLSPIYRNNTRYAHKVYDTTAPKTLIK